MKGVRGEGVDTRVAEGVFLRIGAIRCISPRNAATRWWWDGTENVLKFSGEVLYFAYRKHPLRGKRMIVFDQWDDVFERGRHGETKTDKILLPALLDAMGL